MARKKFKLGPRQEAWLKDLETTRARQIKGALARKSGGFCCLGRACVVARKLGENISVSEESIDGKPVLAYDGEASVLTDRLKNFFGLRDKTGTPKSADPSNECLTVLNDAGISFKDIAAKVRSRPEWYFRESC